MATETEDEADMEAEESALHSLLLKVPRLCCSCAVHEDPLHGWLAF
jgi:hypothetical protein